MVFVIDTGTQDRKPIDAVPDWFRDIYAADTEDARVIHDYAYHLIGALKEPKKMETVRRHVLAQWWFLRDLAEIHPDVFDEFLAAYAERWVSE